MKTGDIVRITDGSYALEITGDGLKHTYVGLEHDQVWKVIGTELVLPAYNSIINGGHINDTIVQNMSNPKRYIFTQEEFLKYLNCPTCKRAW